MTAPADDIPFGVSEQSDQNENTWRPIGDVTLELIRPHILNRPSLLEALSCYEDTIGLRGGVELDRAIDGTPRDLLPHRQGMPMEWSAHLYTLMDLSLGDLREFMGRVIDTFASVEIDPKQPSAEAMLCVAEDLIILFRVYDGRLGA